MKKIWKGAFEILSQILNGFLISLQRFEPCTPKYHFRVLLLVIVSDIKLNNSRRIQKELICVGFEVPTAVVMESSVLGILCRVVR
jgi:hypothetical protein